MMHIFQQETARSQDYQGRSIFVPVSEQHRGFVEQFCLALWNPFQHKKHPQDCDRPSKHSIS